MVCDRVSDQDSVIFPGFGDFSWMDPDPVFKFLRFNHPDPGYGSYANKSAERALKVIIRRKLKNYDRPKKGNNFLLQIIIK